MIHIVYWAIGFVVMSMLGKVGLLKVNLTGFIAWIFLMFFPWGLGFALFKLVGEL